MIPQYAFAINSLARYASSFGREETRNMVETGLLKALDDHTDTEIRTFLLNQLNLVGSNQTVMELEKYLEMEELAEPAAQTLVAIASPKAAKVLYQALSGAGIEVRITLYQGRWEF
jgi:hypothetical protein